MDTDGIEISCRRSDRSGRVLAAALTALLLVAVALGPPPASATVETEPRAGVPGAAAGLTVVGAVREDARRWTFDLRSAAVRDPITVNVLLPTGYDSTTRRYPTLFLYHGTSGGADDWIDAGHAAETTAGLPVIVVSPDTGVDGLGGSWFTDWVDQGTRLGASRWETLLVDQLVPWVDAGFRTVGARWGRAVAGLSQGGFGSMSMAARHPDLFVSAASFSGAPDIARDPVSAVGGGFIVSAIMTGLDQVQPFAAFGDPVLDRVNWRGHNPADLVTNLAHTDVSLWSGNGSPGPLDDPATPDVTLGGVPVEVLVHTSTLTFVDAARQSGVPVRLRDYGAGTHTWPYWARDLREYVPRLMRVFAQRRTTPSSIRYRSVDRTWSEWGWTVANRRSEVQAWSALRDASARGFTFVGDTAVVTTPPTYRPGTRYQVTTTGVPAYVRSDSRGRLRVTVSTARTGTRTAVVRIVRAAA